MNLHDEIAAVAYDLFEIRGYIHGCDLDDWLDAEEIVLSGHAGQEMEEPEEDSTPYTAPVTATRPGEGTDNGEDGEPYNEEMS